MIALNNYSPEMLKVLLDTVKLRKLDILLSHTESTPLKDLMKWEADLEEAFDDAMFEKNRLTFEANV